MRGGELEWSRQGTERVRVASPLVRKRTSRETERQTTARQLSLSFIGRARVKCTQTGKETKSGAAIACL